MPERLCRRSWSYIYTAISILLLIIILLFPPYNHLMVGSFSEYIIRYKFFHGIYMLNYTILILEIIIYITIIYILNYLFRKGRSTVMIIKKVILTIGIIITGIMLVFPPYRYHQWGSNWVVEEYQVRYQLYHGFAMLDYTRLIIQFVVFVCLLSVLYIFFPIVIKRLRRY